MQIAKCKLPISDSVTSAAEDTVVARKRVTPEEMCDRILDFADRVSTVVEALPNTRLGNRIANQLLRSGTSSIGNYEEACAAESKDEFRAQAANMPQGSSRVARMASPHLAAKACSASAVGKSY
jgi:hypothetical protein